MTGTTVARSEAAAPSGGYRRRGGTLALPVLVAILLVAGAAIRSSVGLELSTESIRAQVDALGWQGPAVFMGLVTFRQFLLLPAFLLLSVGGLVFGAVRGTLFGAAGIVLSVVLILAIARTLGLHFLPRGLERRFRRFEAHGQRVGLWVVGAATAHPMGPLTLAHWLAAFSTVTVSAVLLTIAPAAVVRAGLVSTFGAALGEWGSPQSVVALLVLPVMLVPLAHRGVRAHLRGLASGR